MPVLHRQSEEFDERNLFLQVTLGLLSLAEHLDALLARDAPEREGARSDGETGGRSHPVELFVLGAIATSRTLRHRLAAAVPPAPEAPSPAGEEPPPLRPDALRRLLT